MGCFSLSTSRFLLRFTVIVRWYENNCKTSLEIVGYWLMQPRLGRDLSHEAGRQIAENITGFFTPSSPSGRGRRC
jgi:hypothetical protein